MAEPAVPRSLKVTIGVPLPLETSKSTKETSTRLSPTGNCFFSSFLPLLLLAILFLPLVVGWVVAGLPAPLFYRTTKGPSSPHGRLLFLPVTLSLPPAPI